MDGSPPLLVPGSFLTFADKALLFLVTFGGLDSSPAPVVGVAPAVVGVAPTAAAAEVEEEEVEGVAPSSSMSPLSCVATGQMGVEGGGVK